jgi:hypothetical protein
MLLLSVQWINSWWWTDELSETRRVSWQNKFVKLVHLFGFIIKKQDGSFHQPVRLKNLRKDLVTCYIWNLALCGPETWTLRKADQKYLESSEMWYWRRVEKISWTDCVKAEESWGRLRNESSIRCTKWIKYPLYEMNQISAVRNESSIRCTKWIKYPLYPPCLLFTWIPRTDLGIQRPGREAYYTYRPVQRLRMSGPTSQFLHTP